MSIDQLDREIEQLENLVNKNLEDLEKLYFEKSLFLEDFLEEDKIQELENIIMESSNKLDTLYFRKNAKEYTNW